MKRGWTDDLAESFLDRRFHARHAGTSNLGEQVIPAEAVEAAARAVEDQTSAWLYPVVGGNAEDIVRAALEAATPLMLARAWDEGRTAQYREVFMKKPSDPNPYRPTP